VIAETEDDLINGLNGWHKSCQKWVLKKCSGIMCSISKVMKSFIFKGCLWWDVGMVVWDEVHTCM